MRTRPGVSVVVPLGGDEAYALRAREGLSALELGEADELIVVDNNRAPVAAAALGDLGRVIHACGRRSSYFARNAGAEAAAGEWLLFIDADCVPDPGLIAAYFEPPPAPACGAVAGAIEAGSTQTALLARYAVSRRFYGPGPALAGRDYAPTGNLLVRRAAFAALGGFAESVRSGGDVDLCWRLQDARWTLERRPGATVEHRHREDLVSFLSMVARYGAGARWLDRRYPGAAPRWPLLRGLAGTARDVSAHLLRARLEPALFRAIDGLGLVAHNVGYRAGNEAAARPWSRLAGER